VRLAVGLLPPWGGRAPRCDQACDGATAPADWLISPTRPPPRADAGRRAPAPAHRRRAVASRDDRSAVGPSPPPPLPRSARHANRATSCACSPPRPSPRRARSHGRQAVDAAPPHRPRALAVLSRLQRHLVLLAAPSPYLGARPLPLPGCRLWRFLCSCPPWPAARDALQTIAAAKAVAGVAPHPLLPLQESQKARFGAMVGRVTPPRLPFPADRLASSSPAAPARRCCPRSRAMASSDPFGPVRGARGSGRAAPARTRARVGGGGPAPLLRTARQGVLTSANGQIPWGQVSPEEARRTARGGRRRRTDRGVAVGRGGNRQPPVGGAAGRHGAGARPAKLGAAEGAANSGAPGVVC
jgi:hypothetical protein